MDEMQKNVADKTIMLRICIVYRIVSLSASTLVYLFFNEREVTVLRIGIATGMVAAGSMGIWLHKRSFSDPGNAAGIWKTAPIYIEMVAYGLLLVLSGGFYSPYLWYFISALTMVMANERFAGQWKRGTLLSLLWCVLCAILGARFSSENALTYSYINTVIGFLLVSGGFYTLFIYIYALNRSREAQQHINELLREETQRSNQALQHTLELYSTLQLFGISEPDKVMGEIVGLLQRTVAPSGCLLIKTTSLHQIEMSRSIGLPPEHEIQLLEAVLSFPAQQMQQSQLEIMDMPYSVTPIKGLYGIVGVLITPLGVTSAGESGVEAQQQFYLYLAGVLLQNLDLQEMVEDSIISEEQARIVSEIHDTVIQKLFAVVCKLQLLETRQEMIDTREMKKRLHQIKRVVESTMAELREAICGIRWESDEKASLNHKLTLFLEEMELLSGASIDLAFDTDQHTMSISQKTAIYRIVCEAVSNAMRHGKASAVQVSVSASGEDWVAKILDNGIGFDVHHPPHQGQGLKNMYRMASRLKGQITVDSRIGSSTTVNCRFPR